MPLCGIGKGASKAIAQGTDPGDYGRGKKLIEYLVRSSIDLSYVNEVSNIYDSEGNKGIRQKGKLIDMLDYRDVSDDKLKDIVSSRSKVS